MRTMRRFMERVLRMPMPWPLWVAALFLTNTAAVLFLPRLEACVVLGGLLVGAVLQMALFASFGFVRLLGLGHFHWFPMVAWLIGRVGQARGDSGLYGWLLAVIVLCSVSLLIDTIDVIRYARGERDPSVQLDA